MSSKILSKNLCYEWTTSQADIFITQRTKTLQWNIIVLHHTVITGAKVQKGPLRNIYNFNTYIDFSHLLLSNSSTAHIWIVTYWEILKQRWIDKDQQSKQIHGQEKDKVGRKKTIWKKLWRWQMGTKSIPLHFSSLHLWLKKTLTENNLGQTTFYGQPTYVLYAPFSFLSY